MIERKFIGDVGIFHTATIRCGGSLICIYSTNLRRVKEKMDELSIGFKRAQQEGVQG